VNRVHTSTVSRSTSSTRLMRVPVTFVE
jgi:hypothetical protein